MVETDQVIYTRFARVQLLSRPPGDLHWMLSEQVIILSACVGVKEKGGLVNVFLGET